MKCLMSTHFGSACERWGMLYRWYSSNTAVFLKQLEFILQVNTLYTFIFFCGEGTRKRYDLLFNNHSFNSQVFNVSFIWNEKFITLLLQRWVLSFNFKHCATIHYNICLNVCRAVKKVLSKFTSTIVSVGSFWLDRWL